MRFNFQWLFPHALDMSRLASFSRSVRRIDEQLADLPLLLFWIKYGVNLPQICPEYDYNTP